MNTQTTPLARAFRPAELPGRGSKHLVVPAGRRGVVLRPDGEITELASGRHLIVSFWDRLRGRDAGMWAGYLPAGEFVVRLQAGNLLSQDDELMEVMLLCQAAVLDAGRFFSAQVVPHGKAQGEVFNLAVDIHDLLAPGIRQERAADLLGEAAGERVLMPIYPALERLFASQGVYLDYVVLLSFLHAEDRLAAAQKAAELTDRLEPEAARDRLDAVENEADAEAALSELGLDQLPGTGVHPVFKSTAKPNARPSLAAAVQGWLSGLRGEGRGNRRPRLAALFKRGNPQKQPPRRRRRRYPRFWWRGRVIWMAFVVALTYGLLRLVNALTGGASFLDRWEVNLIILGGGAWILLDNLKKLYQEWEHLQREYWVEPGVTLVDDLVGQNRPQADALVRRQCAVDLESAQKSLNALRSRLYRRGEEAVALELRAMEKEIEALRQTVLDPTQGTPPYLDPALKISQRFWDALLDYDEGLLVRASAFNEQVQDFVQQVVASGFALHDLKTLQSSLDGLRHHFFNRSRTLRSEVAP